MSWLFGLISPEISKENKKKCEAVHGGPQNCFFQDNKFYFVVGGNQKACFAGQDAHHNESFWIGLGCILDHQNDAGKLYINDQWEKISEDVERLNDIDGHFVFLQYKHDRFEIRTDRLGLRTLFWTQTDNEIVISTRIDWIAKYLGKSQIDYKTVGSRWLIFNQLSYQSLVHNIHRLGPNGKLIIKGNFIQHYEQPFTPAFQKNFSAENATSLLTSFISPVLDKSTKITFGLSGGLDSRVLLSLLLKYDRNNFQTHTFGNIHDPDVFIPKEMGANERFPNVTYDNPLPSALELIPLLNDYAAQTNLTEPISTVLRLRNYANFDTTNSVLLDGGFGEIARRQYLNRSALKGKKPIQGKNIESVLANLRVQRGNIFCSEILRQMEQGIREEIQYMFNTMPDVNEIGLENYLDLWAVRTRFPNFGSDEQARLDSHILNYMPFAQPRFIEMVFSMPVELRNNGKLFRRIIASNYPALSNYPLVKGGTTYPFYFSTKAAWLLTKLKSKLGYRHSQNHLHIFLDMMKEFIYDLLHSRHVKEHAAYDYRRIQMAVENYYAGNKAYTNEVNWWLTFELWRRNMEGK